MNAPQLGDYVLKHYSRFLTAHENAVLLHLRSLFKHGGEPPLPGTALDTDRVESVYRRSLSDDPAVIQDAQAGWFAARERIAARIVHDHPDEVHLNRCPVCGALTASPTARMCLACPHTWFHVPREAP